MQKQIGVIFFALLCSQAVANDVTSNEVTKEIGRFSRYEGYQIAAELKSNTEWIDLPSVIQGVQDYLAGKTPQEIIGSQDEPDYIRVMNLMFGLEAKNNLQKATDFLSSLAKEDKIHVIENGKVLYEVISEGTSEACVSIDSSPTLQYSISTLGGQEVVTTYNGLGPQRTPLSETMPGFASGVVGMRLGEKRKLFIHPDLGYDDVGHVPPRSLLIVNVEVVKV